MPNGVSAKTKSAPSLALWLVVQLIPMSIGRIGFGNKIIGALIAIFALSLVFQAVNAYFFVSEAVMHLSATRFEVRIADNDRTRTKGLSGTSQIPADEAMVFIFDHDDRWSIWMKDMNYAIDIVWLDKDKKVVDFVTDVSPDSYPNKTFMPKEEARYVVEFQSGVVEKVGIEVGQEAVFSGTSREI